MFWLIAEFRNFIYNLSGRTSTWRLSQRNNFRLVALGRAKRGRERGFRVKNGNKSSPRRAQHQQALGPFNIDASFAPFFPSNSFTHGHFWSSLFVQVFSHGSWRQLVSLCGCESGSGRRLKRKLLGTGYSFEETNSFTRGN